MDYDTNDTNSKDNGNNAVNFDSLNIKLEVGSIGVNCLNTVKDENSFQSSTIKPVNVYANYGTTDVSSTHSSSMHIKQEDCMVNTNSNVFTSNVIKLEPEIKSEVDHYRCKYFKVSVCILFIQLYIEYIVVKSLAGIVTCSI